MNIDDGMFVRPLGRTTVLAYSRGVCRSAPAFRALSLASNDEEKPKSKYKRSSMRSHAPPKPVAERAASSVERVKTFAWNLIPSKVQTLIEKYGYFLFGYWLTAYGSSFVASLAAVKYMGPETTDRYDVRVRARILRKKKA